MENTKNEYLQKETKVIRIVKNIINCTLKAIL